MSKKIIKVGSVVRWIANEELKDNIFEVYKTEGGYFYISDGNTSAEVRLAEIELVKRS